jgi:hypothetical protein
VVPLLAEAQVGRSAGVEANGHNRPAEAHRRHRVVQAEGAARGLDGDVDTLPAQALDGSPNPILGLVRIEHMVRAQLQRQIPARGHRLDGGHALRARQPRHLHQQQSNRAQPHDRDVVAELEPSVVDSDERNSAEAHVQRVLARFAGRKAHEGIAGLGRRVDVEHRLLTVRRSDVHQVADPQLGDPRPDLLDHADHLVAQHRGIGGARRVRPDEGTQLAVEYELGEARRAAIEVELGSVAYAARQSAHPHIAGLQPRSLLFAQSQRAGSFQHQRAGHS